MNLTAFLTSLFNQGMVTVPREMYVPGEDDLAESAVLLKQFYNLDRLEMPFIAPAFDEAAALWASRYLFHATQLVLLRALAEAVMDEYLMPYPQEQTPEVIYSADLSLRYLVGVFKISSGVAPDDPLVIRLKKTAADWPFSSVGLKLEVDLPSNDLFGHPSLNHAYLDRVIQHKDHTRLKGMREQELLGEMLGLYQTKLWPGLELIPKEPIL